MFAYTENTQNPNPIFKITIYCIKHTKTPKYFRSFVKNEKYKKIIFWDIYKFHNSYFGTFVNFVNVGIFIYFVYFIYCWGPHSLTSWQLRSTMLDWLQDIQQRKSSLNMTAARVSQMSLARTSLINFIVEESYQVINFLSQFVKSYAWTPIHVSGTLSHWVP